VQHVAQGGIGLSGFPHADALVALYPFLTKVVVPRGTMDIAGDRPPNDVVLLATKASMVVRRDLHPALQYLLLNAPRKSTPDPVFSAMPTRFLPPKPAATFR
jgi:hypothetical protein